MNKDNITILRHGWEIFSKYRQWPFSQDEIYDINCYWLHGSLIFYIIWKHWSTPIKLLLHLFWITYFTYLFIRSNIRILKFTKRNRNVEPDTSKLRYNTWKNEHVL